MGKMNIVIIIHYMNMVVNCISDYKVFDIYYNSVSNDNFIRLIAW